MEQDPAQQMLQQAQAAHAALQRQPLIRPTALAEYWAKEGIRRANKQCPSDRCKECELRPCKTLQSTTKQMYK